MKRVIKLSTFLLCSFIVLGVANGQTPTPSPSSAPALEGIKANMAIGEVVNVESANNQILIKTIDGEITAQLNEKTEYVRVQPGATSLKDATPITLADVGLGDKVLAMGVVSADKKNIPAKRIVLMTKADISKKQASEREQWRRRGIAGVITSLNISKYEITIAVRTLTSETTWTLVETEKAKFLRYPPNSVKFSDTKPGNFYDLKVGDQLRSLGAKSADGKTFTPEEIVTGSFKTVAGTITAIDVAKGEIIIKTLDKEKPLTIVVGKDTTIRRLPQMMGFGGGQMGQGNQGQGGQVIRPQPQGQGTPPQGAQGGQQGGGRMGGGNLDMDEMIERIPPIPITELKVGDMIGASSSAGSDPTRVTAIKMIAGIEGIVRLQQTQAAQRGASGGASPSLNLPGLDAMGIP